MEENNKRDKKEKTFDVFEGTDNLGFEFDLVFDF